MIWMEKRQVELGQIRFMVEQAKSENPESSVIIITDKAAPTGQLIDLMDQVRLGRRDDHFGGGGGRSMTI